jgi:hypothetical protein
MAQALEPSPYAQALGRGPTQPHGSPLNCGPGAVWGFPGALRGYQVTMVSQTRRSPQTGPGALGVPLPHGMGVGHRGRASGRGYTTKVRGLTKIETASDCNLAGFGRALAHRPHPCPKRRRASLRAESQLKHPPATATRRVLIRRLIQPSGAASWRESPLNAQENQERAPRPIANWRG